MNNEIWEQAARDLRSTIGENHFKAWIEPLAFSDQTDGVVRFQAPTSFVATWVKRNYGDQILNSVNAAGANAQRVEFSVSRAAPANGAKLNGGQGNGGQAGPSQTAPAQHAAPASVRASEESELNSAPLDGRFCFDNFVVGKPNALAHAAAKRVAEAGPVTFNPLFLYGGVGLGKTHLMHAIAWELRASRPEFRVLYLSAEQFMYRFVRALRDKQVMDFKGLFRSVDVLMVDDVQFIAGKEGTQEEFFHTFNALVDQNRQIVISADRAPGEIKDLEDRIRSRLQSGLVVDLHPTDYELRLGIMQQKAEQYAETYGRIAIEGGVLEFLAHRITTNVRVLEGALTRLFAFASLVGRDISMDLVNECLADILRTSEQRVTVEEIMRKVAEHYNVRLSDIVGPKRVRTIARPRQVAMFLAKELTSRSLPEIGRRFGGRDHTTIMHGVRKIEELRASDRQLSEDLDLLRRLLQS